MTNSNLPKKFPNFVIFKTADGKVNIDEKRIGELFQKDRSVISKQLKNIFEEGELNEQVVCAKFALTTQHGAMEGKTRARVYHLATIQEKLKNSPDYSSNSPDYSSDSPVLKELLASILFEWGYEKMPGRLNKDKFKQLLIEVCKNKWVSISSLSALLERDPKALQDQYLTEMIAKNEIQLKYPDTRNHPQQAYGVFTNDK